MMPFREEYYWPRFCKALGKPEWIEAEEYATPSLRGKHAASLSSRSTSGSTASSGVTLGCTHSACGRSAPQSPWHSNARDILHKHDGELAPDTGGSRLHRCKVSTSLLLQ
jgi:hypothetical protein